MSNNLFEKILEADIPKNVKDICTEALHRTQYITEIGILGLRIQRCNEMIRLLKSIQDNERMYITNLEITCKKVNADTKVKFDQDTWPQLDDFMRTEIDTILEWLTEMRSDAANALKVVLDSNK